MKESKIVLTILLVLVFLTAVSVHCISKNVTKTKQIKIASNIINEGQNNEIEIVTKEDLEINDNIVGTLEIPKLELIAPIQEGTSDEILKVAVGHFKESSFWNGNVALASHNRSRYAHYFEAINNLKNGDEILYKTKMGEKKYSVYENKIIDSTDWSVIENTKENVLTLITCVKNNQDKRLCIKAKEIKEI